MFLLVSNSRTGGNVCPTAVIRLFESMRSRAMASGGVGQRGIGFSNLLGGAGVAWRCNSATHVSIVASTMGRNRLCAKGLANRGLAASEHGSEEGGALRGGAAVPRENGEAPDATDRRDWRSDAGCQRTQDVYRCEYSRIAGDCKRKSGPPQRQTYCLTRSVRSTGSVDWLTERSESPPGTDSDGSAEPATLGQPQESSISSFFGRMP